MRRMSKRRTLRRILAGPALLLAAGAIACGLFGPKQFESDAEYKHYVAGLHLSGLTAQAAIARAEPEGFKCQITGNVISGSPEELVVVCRRRAVKTCAQDQSIVLRLDWVGTPKPALAPGMRVRDVGSALGQPVCE
jgi:hypothetical protein